MRLLCLSVLVLLSLPGSLLAQRTGGGAGGTGGGRTNGSGASIGNPSSPGVTNPDFNPPDLMFFISGEVVVDDGSALNNTAMLQTDCKGQRHTIAHTDSQGRFSFQLGGETQTQGSEIPDATDTAARASIHSGPGPSGISGWKSCQLEAIAPGFTSQQVELAAHLNGDSYVDIGRIVLHRMAQVQGLMVSATSQAAPPKASKRFGKGLSLEKKSKWDAAQQKFQSAVDIYPKYAAAWFELGRMQLKLDREHDAQASFQKSITADPHFLPPYQEMIALALRAQNWKDLGETTEQALRLDPVSFPQYWFLNSAANYNQRKYGAAERSALRGIETDIQHRFPRLEYLLGLSLAQRREYKGAAEHIRDYLRAGADPEDVVAARAELKQLEASETRHPGAGSAQ